MRGAGTFARGMLRVGAFLFALVFALASAFVIWNCCRQLERDRKYRDELHSIEAQIDARRKQTGHQPSARELEGFVSRRMTIYMRLRDRPERLQPLGARAPDDYMFAVWRGERDAYYYSWSGEDTTDSGAWILLLALGVPLAGVSVLLIWLSLRQRKRAGEITPSRTER